MAKTNNESQKNKILATLLTQLDLVAKQLMELEVPYKKKYQYIPPHECRKSKEHKSGWVAEILSVIFH